MAELVALRAILLNVMFKLANGQPLTAKETRRLVDQSDSDKPKKTRDRLFQARVSEGQPERKTSDRFFVVSGSIKISAAVGDKPSVGSR
jgi:hypothetical protein